MYKYETHELLKHAHSIILKTYIAWE